jgi:hypothetical protein
MPASETFYAPTVQYARGRAAPLIIAISTQHWSADILRENDAERQEGKGNQQKKADKSVRPT